MSTGPTVDSLLVASFGVVVRFADGSSVDVASQWIRDACRCPTCRDSTSGAHLLSIDDVVGFAVERATTYAQTVAVDLRRAGVAHRVEVPVAALWGLRSPGQKPQCVWGAHHREDLISQADRMPALSRVSDIEHDLVKYGIALGRGLEATDREVLRFASKLGFVRETNDGEYFEMRSEAANASGAYRAAPLALHTDSPYRNPAPTVQLLHCLRRSPRGGLSRFSDGFLAAEVLRSHHPSAFAALTETVVEFRSISEDVDLRSRRSIIDIDADGVVQSIAVNHGAMEAPEVSGAAARAFYSGYERFAALLVAGRIDLTLGPGDVVVFDNRRVLHGSGGFDAGDGRLLQGCYIDVDAIESAVRLSREEHETQQLQLW